MPMTAAAVAAQCFLAAAYTPPGLLARVVERKRREVDRLHRLPDARDDGPWALRLAYPASQASYRLAEACGWKREKPVVIGDLKRASGAIDGGIDAVWPELAYPAAIGRLLELGCDAAMVRDPPNASVDDRLPSERGVACTATLEPYLCSGGCRQGHVRRLDGRPALVTAIRRRERAPSASHLEGFHH